MTTEFVGTWGTKTLDVSTSRDDSRAWMASYRRRSMALDVLVAMLATSVCYLLRFGAADAGILPWLGAVPVAWVAALAATGTYRDQVLGFGSDEYRATGRAVILLAFTVFAVSYLGHFDWSRALVLPVPPLMFVGSLVGRSALRRSLAMSRLAGECLTDTVVVGRVDSVAMMIREIRSAPQTGMRVVGACVSDLDGGPVALDRVVDVPVYGTPDSALTTVDALGAGAVAVSSHPDLVGPPLRRLGWALAERDVDLYVSPGIVEVAGPRLSLRPAAGLSMLHVERPISSGARVAVKRALDSVLGFALLLAAMPVFVAVAVAIKVTSPGPIFFRQERVGVEGRSFGMVKFRTMVVDAEARLQQMSRDGQVNAVLFKDRHDPRITSVGRILRRLSIDELPQLINVVLGDMSLVGPRPPLRREVDLYEPDAIQRLRVRPGMTGLWQISGRSDLDWEQSLRLDLWYVDNWSPVLDLQILVRTVKAVLSGSGAY